jgi:hypothetical protein
MPENNISNSSELNQITLVPNKFDIKNIRVQVLIGSTLILLCVLAIFAQTMNIGFLLDDFLHIDYLSKASQGNFQLFLNSLTGNWAQSDIMKSYRPIISISLFIDYLFFHTNPFGYHLVNVLLFFICALLVSLITLELTGLCGNRLGASPSIWAALLFAVYPLHPEVVGWIIGRGDLLCALFYFFCIFSYLRFRLTRENSYLYAALVSFLLSLLSKETAVTIPLVIAAAEFLLYKSDQIKFIHRALYVSWFWVVLGSFATFRFVLLGTVVGGYGDNNIVNINNIISVFAHKAALLKTIFPFHEEMQFPNWCTKVLAFAYLLSALCFVSKLLTKAFRPRIYLFLLFWLAISILPSFQIWNIYPNLVGSRLFFIASAPLCIFISFICLPAIDQSSKTLSKLLATPAIIALSIIFAIWSYALHINIQPWIIASRQMQILQNEVTQILKNIPEGQKALFLNLPPDYKGAGMLTRPQYLKILISPPFTDKALDNKIATIESATLANRDYLWPNEFRKLINNKNISQIFIWNSADGKFVPWANKNQNGSDSSNSEYNFSINENTCKQLSIQPKEALLSSADKWKVLSEHVPCITTFANFLRIYPGKQAVKVYFPDVNLDPLKANFAQIFLQFQTTTGCRTCFGNKMKIIWLTKDGQEHEASILNNHNKAFFVSLGRYRSWTLAGNIAQVGIKFEPGEYFADLSNIQIISQNMLTPDIELLNSSNQSIESSVYTPLDLNAQDNDFVIKFNGSHIKESNSARILISKAGSAFDANDEANLTTAYPSVGDAHVLLELDIPQTSGLVKLPKELYQSPGLHQLRIILLNSNQEIIGLPSEPITINIKSK